KLHSIYLSLLKKHVPQGWWPLLEIKQNNGYHPKNYSYPKTKRQVFEICIGAILTQNTSWSNASKALKNLYKKTFLRTEKILKLNFLELAQIIKSSGYYNQKAKKILEFSKFFLKLKNKPSRDELLGIWGIGPETADSILLYAYKEPHFIIDKYTFRFLKQKGVLAHSQNFDYEKIKSFVEKNLKKDYKIYQEFHALIVKEEKEKSD
ncbi:MAG: endonuclease III domain-containing protein, partial [Candidatus Micrarchaeota archaeon]|nr:endonuclease III domain-containing protein [Candidatus Micrarchaeota archaeon]